MSNKNDKYQYLISIEEDFCLKDSDFYPAADNRTFNSYIDDVEDGDNFADFCEYIFELYEEEGYYD